MPEKKSRFLLELNEMPNGGGRVATDFVRLFNFRCIKTTFSRNSTAQLIYPRSNSNLRTQAGFVEHVSVNGSDFVKYSTRSISAPSSQSNLPPSSFWRLSCIRKKTGSDLRLIANHPVFQFEAWFFPSLFRLDIIKDSINYESRLFLSKSKHFLHFSSIY